MTTLFKTMGVTLAAMMMALTMTLLPGPAVPQAQAATRGYTLVLGDSLTYFGTPRLHALRPGWVIDGVRGRKVDRIPARIRYWTERKGRKPSRIVVALGSNEVRTWEPRDYDTVRRMLPKTRILFVTPYRDARIFGKARYLTMFRYSRAMRYRAAKSPTICVADWARLAERNEKGLLRDGVHQTRYGLRVWSRLISRRAHDCGF